MTDPNYSFRNALFSALRNKSSQNELELHINSVIEGEVESHIKRDVKKAAKELLEAVSHPKFAGFRKISPYQEKLDIPKADEWVQEAQWISVIAFRLSRKKDLR